MCRECIRLACRLVVCVSMITVLSDAQGASYATANFVVHAATPDFARQVGEKAEQYRRTLAMEWLGKEFPNWSRKCPIRVQAAQGLPAAGVTSFNFDQGEVFGWNMEVKGSPSEILDSVLPHEVNHTIFATHFRQALPRWLDEGAATTVEDASEKSKHQKMLVHFLRTGRGISFNEMYSRMDYPAEMLPLYAQGFSVTRYLIEQKGRPHFVNYVKAGLASNDWPTATREHYGYKSLGSLQMAWLDWVQQGSPTLIAQNQEKPTETLVTLASQTRKSRPDADLLYRVEKEEPSSALRSGPVDEEQLVPVRRPARRQGRVESVESNPQSTPIESIEEPAEFEDAPDSQVLLEWHRSSPTAASDVGSTVFKSMERGAQPTDHPDSSEPVLDARLSGSSRVY